MDQNVINEVIDWCKGCSLDIELLVDVSGSMQTGKRLDQAMEFSRAAAEIGAQIDEDGGIGLTFFSDFPFDQSWEDVPSADIAAKFASAKIGGTTDTLLALEGEIAQHYDRKKNNPGQRTLIVCVTDGEPNGGLNGRVQIKDRLSEIQSGVDFSQKVPELKVLFYQVGDDAQAKAWLQDLDTDDKACGLLVESCYFGKDNRRVEDIYRDALREHMVKND